MRRLTRGVGLFGSPAAAMTAKRVKLPTPKTEEHPPDDDAAVPEKPPEPRPAVKKGWLNRLFGSDDEPGK